MGRSILACANAGGHFRQLVDLVDRIPDVGEVTWLTHEGGVHEDILEARGRGGDRLVTTAYAAPRDLRNLARNARTAEGLLRTGHFDLAISTGAGIAVAVLPQARLRGVRSVFVESATRSKEPSLSGRLLRYSPGVEMCCQHAPFGRGWRRVGSVHDNYERGPDRAVATLSKVVVTLGTIEPFGFRRLVERLAAILPDDAEVLWQTGATDVGGLPIDGQRRVPADVLEQAMVEADLIVAHAGTGTALTAFAAGRVPVLVPRRAGHGEHIDDHQVGTARDLADRGIAVYAEVDDLDPQLLRTAATRTVVRSARPPALAL